MCICAANNNTYLPVAVQIARGPPAFHTETFYFSSRGFTCAGIFNQQLLIFITSERHCFGDGHEQCLLPGIAQTQACRSEEFMVYIIRLRSRFPPTQTLLTLTRFTPAQAPATHPGGSVCLCKSLYECGETWGFNIIINRGMTANLASRWRYNILQCIAS